MTAEETMRMIREALEENGPAPGVAHEPCVTDPCSMCKCALGLRGLDALNLAGDEALVEAVKREQTARMKAVCEAWWHGNHEAPPLRAKFPDADRMAEKERLYEHSAATGALAIVSRWLGGKT